MAWRVAARAARRALAALARGAEALLWLVSCLAGRLAGRQTVQTEGQVDRRNDGQVDWLADRWAGGWGDWWTREGQTADMEGRAAEGQGGRNGARQGGNRSEVHVTPSSLASVGSGMRPLRVSVLTCQLTNKESDLAIGWEVAEKK